MPRSGSSGQRRSEFWKSWVGQTISNLGTSQLVIQGTAGTTEDHLKYSWNYALLIAQGPSRVALVSSPVLRGMEQGRIVRFEELTRCAAVVQDALISILSDKVLAIPSSTRWCPPGAGSRSSAPPTPATAASTT